MHEIDGRTRNWHGDSVDGVLGIFAFGKGEWFWTLIFESKSCIRMKLTRGLAKSLSACQKGVGWAPFVARLSLFCTTQMFFLWFRPAIEWVRLGISLETMGGVASTKPL